LLYQREGIYSGFASLSSPIFIKTKISWALETDNS